MKSIYEFIVKNKKSVFVVGILVLIVLMATILGGGSPEVSTPIIQEPGRSPFEISDANTLDLLFITPPARSGESIDTYQIVSFDFAQAVDPSTAEFITRPFIKLKVLHNPDIPRRLSFVPDEIGWEHNVLYKLTIQNLRGVNGEVLEEEIIYDYYNSPPSFDNYLPPY
jgi:hypothetical protein